MGGMNADWLSQLAPDHAPPPPGWWPLAPGWWVLAALLVLLITCVVVVVRRPSFRQRRLALRELRTLQAAAVSDAELARQLEHLLRRYAVTHFGRTAVARLSGQAWIDFVVAHGGRALAGPTGADLLRAAYGGSGAGHRSQWLGAARAFIKGRGPGAGLFRRRRAAAVAAHGGDALELQAGPP